MIFIIGILVVLLTIGWYLEKFLIKKNWSNPFLNTFYIFNMIFSSPFNVLFGVIVTSFIGIILALYQFDIVNPSNTNITKLINPPIAGIITLSIITIILFIVLTIFSGITVYRIWADDKGIKGYKNLLEFSKRFIFRIPLLIVTLGFFLPNLMMGEITSLSYEIMVHGLYVIPIFMLITKKINFRIKNN
ncbi:hypothetical protein [Aliarcobacter butzleri]|uniref:hypothetical protein n=1 Tax=Aliarcobacter butzleri TaxID=28197 RepID=UPI001260BF73|nr:hypothetical protein [Aliarcobacter butzleri]MDN5096411.1 hypothetical protein [Aliarcobacter butzleri]